MSNNGENDIQAEDRLAEHESQRNFFLVAFPVRYTRLKTVRQSRRDKGNREKQSRRVLAGAINLTRAIVAEKKRHSERVKKRMGRE